MWPQWPRSSSRRSRSDPAASIQQGIRGLPSQGRIHLHCVLAYLSQNVEASIQVHFPLSCRRSTGEGSATGENDGGDLFDPSLAKKVTQKNFFWGGPSLGGREATAISFTGPRLARPGSRYMGTTRESLNPHHGMEGSSALTFSTLGKF